MAFSITTAFPGNFLEKVLTKATIGNELVENNLIHVELNVLKRLYFGQLVATTMLQHRVEQPTSDNSKGAVNYTEKYLEPSDVMAYTEFNPREFEKIWRKWQPTGPMAMETWSPKAQSEFLQVFADKVAEEIGDQMINGIKSASTDGLYFNGIVPRILGDKDVFVAGEGETTYVGKFKAMLKKLPKAIRKKSNLKFITSIDDTDEYDAELKANVYKNADVTVAQKLAFNGVPVVGLANWPKGLIVLTLADSSLNSNLYAAGAWAQDETFIKEDLVSNAGEKHFLKMLMKFDTNIAFADYIVICDERTASSTNTYNKLVTSAEDVATIPTTGAVLGAKVTYTTNATAGITVATVAIAKGKTASWYFDGSAWKQKA